MVLNFAALHRATGLKGRRFFSKMQIFSVVQREILQIGSRTIFCTCVKASDIFLCRSKAMGQNFAFAQ
jgi:hypothetical protein